VETGQCSNVYNCAVGKVCIPPLGCL
jgi:hypothetical protein